MDLPNMRNMKFQKISQMSDSEDDDMDPSKPIYSLSHYVDDEEELVSQMFKSLKVKKIKSMLPPALRNAPMADIQRLFVQELTGMSRTRLLATINGDEVHTSSSDSDLSDLTASSSEGDDARDDDSFNKDSKSSSNNSTNIDPQLTEGQENKTDPSGLTTMDLIELEMRAKLIKTMLEKHPNEDPSEALENYLNIKIKQEPLSPELPPGLVKKEKMTSENSSRTSNRSDSSDRSRSRASRKKLSRSRSSSSSSRGKKSRSRSRSSSKSSTRLSPGQTSSSGSSGDSTKKTCGDGGKVKRKLTRKEFEERMKKAKMNRSYRKREDSDDDSFDDDDDDEEHDEDKRKLYKKWKAKMQKKLDTKAALWEKKYFEGLKKETEITKRADPEAKNSDMEEGEVLEKEEGEIESNEEAEQEEPPVVEEEEEGACTPSDQEDDNEEKIPKSDDNPKNVQIDNNESPAEEISTYSEKVSRTRTRKSKKHKHRGSVGKDEIANDDDDIDENIQPNETEEEPVEEIALSSADENSMQEANMSLPSKSDRQSVSFSLLKKSLNLVKGGEGSDEEIETSAIHDGDSNFLRNFLPNEHIEIVGEESEKETDQSKEVIESAPTVELPSTAAGSTPDEVVRLGRQTPLSKEESMTGSASAENSCDANIDIIGFIEPKGGKKDSDPFDENFVSGSSWSSRWLQSEKVQTVVSDSKIMSKVRKNIQAKGKIEKPIVYSAPPQPAVQAVAVVRQPAKPANVIASMEEYEKTVGVKIPARSAIARKLPPGLDSGDSEDSEEEALWSQIMKK